MDSKIKRMLNANFTEEEVEIMLALKGFDLDKEERKELRTMLRRWNFRRKKNRKPRMAYIYRLIDREKA